MTREQLVKTLLQFEQNVPVKLRVSSPLQENITSIEYVCKTNESGKTVEVIYIC